MKLSKNGFNLGEMLICIGLIAVVVAMMIPAAMSKKPGKNKALFRKAYYITEKIVYDLINDEDKEKGFPGTKSGDYSAGSDQSTGFGYFNNLVTVKIPKGPSFPDVARTKANTGRYLCARMVAKMNTTGVTDCYNTHTMPANGVSFYAQGQTAANVATSPNFVTTDGVSWVISLDQICVKNRASCAADSTITIKVDVNGNDPPNTTAGNDPDRFTFSFDPEGKMSVPVGSKAAEYLKSNAIYK